MSETDIQELQRVSKRRFTADLTSRNKGWACLCNHFWKRFVRADSVVLDLGCSYGQFINHIESGRKYAMDTKQPGGAGPSHSIGFRSMLQT